MKTIVKRNEFLNIVEFCRKTAISLREIPTENFKEFSTPTGVKFTFSGNSFVMTGPENIINELNLKLL